MNNIKKRFISCICVLAMVCAIIGVQSEEVKASYYGSCGANLTWILDTSNWELTITGSGAMTNYSYNSSAPWSRYKYMINKIHLPDGITSIGEYAFYTCTHFTEITIPDSVISIGKGAFSFCKGLTEITIPDGITVIKEDAFSLCDNLEKVIIPDSVTNIEKGAFTACESLKKITIPDGVQIIREDTFSGCDALSEITIPDSVQVIEDYSFNGCYNLKDVYYGGDEEEWNSIDMDDWSYVNELMSAQVHYNCFEIDGLSAATSHQVIGVLNQKDSGVGQVELSYNEQDLAESSYVYNHDLATFAAGLSTMMYSIGDLDMKNALRGLGYKEENMIFYSDEGGKTSPHYIAHKTVNLNNMKTNIIIVVMRGTYNKEWIDNFNPGYDTSTHQGFLNAANFVYYNILSYMKGKGLNEGRTKIIVTGHSRGAAVANLVGKSIIDNVTNISDNDIYVYTFATPNVTEDKDRSNSRYNNIFNIVNPEDFVTKVMLSAWGYGRYGISYVLPSKTTDCHFLEGDYVDYSLYLERVQNLFKQYRPNDKDGYQPYFTGMEAVSSYVYKISKIVSSTKEYYTKNLYIGLDLHLKNEQSLYNLYTKFLGYFKSNDEGYLAISYGAIVAAIAGYWGYAGTSTVEFFLLHQLSGSIPKIAPEFACAHYAETYLAAMNVITPEELKQRRISLGGIVNCPVDITIKNNEGEIVGQIINNRIVQDIESEVVLNVEGDSKSFLLPKGADYTIELTGNDNGYMDYSLREIDPDTGEVIRKYYNNVPVEKGMSYVQKITGDTEVKTSDLVDDNYNVVTSTGIYTMEDSEKLSVNVTVEGIGTANSFTNLLPGDYVNLCAYTDENNSFLGWYDEDGKVITEKEVYGISVSEDLNLIAKFTNVQVPVSGICFENNEIIMKAGEYATNTANVLPSNATNKSVRYSSSDESVATVGDYGIIQAVGNGVAIITAITEEGSITTTATVYVGEQPTTQKITTSEKDTTKNQIQTQKLETQKQETEKEIYVKNTKMKKIKTYKKALKVSWKRIKGIKGYQLQYSTSKKFKKSKYVTIKKAKTTTKTIKKLKSKKKYYVRIRTYIIKDGKKIYSRWSKSKYRKTK